MSSRAWTVACLAGDGVGPELMAETSRVLVEVARLHALRIDDVHLPFGGEALTRFGHPLPLSTRDAYRSADAIFVSSPDDAAFDGVKADLDLAWRVSRVHNEVRGDLVVVEPIGYGTDELAIARAFQLAAARRARLTSVGSTPEWSDLVAAEADRWDGLSVEHLSLGGVLTRFRDHPGTVDLVVAGSHLAGAIVDAAAHLAGSLHTVASAWLSTTGPGVFAPRVCDSSEVAGFGVADPVGTLLAASLLLGEGLGARSAARTLERAVAAADGLRPLVTTTREFADLVIENLSAARTDTEHFQEVNR
jgi:3-isopropylmalate dehydrogenase